MGSSWQTPSLGDALTSGVTRLFDTKTNPERKTPKPQDVLLPLHNRSIQVLLARTQPNPQILFSSSHGARLGLVPICSRNLDASQCLLLGLALSLRCQLLLQLSAQRGFAFCRSGPLCPTFNLSYIRLLKLQLSILQPLFRF